MKNQQLDLLRVGRLALRGIGMGGNCYAKALEEMHYSTGITLETCQEVMERLAKQDSQWGYERDLQEICSATDKVRREKKQAAEMGSSARFTGLERAWLSLQEETRRG